MTQYDEWKPAGYEPGPADGEVVIAALANGRVTLLAMGMDADENPVWMSCYEPPYFEDGGWRGGCASYDDAVQNVRLWCRLPVPPAVTSDRQKESNHVQAR